MNLPQELAGLEKGLRDRLEPGKARFIPPMLAKLTDQVFSSEEWFFERKFDGERILAVRREGQVTLFTRNQKVANAPYPELVGALEALGRPQWDFVLDGEVVALDANGQTSFSLLQRRMQKNDPDQSLATGIHVDYYVFDLIHLGGYDLLSLPCRTRKEILRSGFDLDDPLGYSDHYDEFGAAYHEQACQRGWEGLIAKRADAPYQTRRSSDWLKLKCVRDQEFVIAGYTPPKGTRIGFGALLLGYYDDGHLRYAGKVGTGFDTTALRLLHEHLVATRRDASPFGEPVPEREVTWVAPKLICQVGFTEWTGDGRLRHPRFKGLRRDKAPEEVVREPQG